MTDDYGEGGPQSMLAKHWVSAPILATVGTASLTIMMGANPNTLFGAWTVGFWSVVVLSVTTTLTLKARRSVVTDA